MTPNNYALKTVLVGPEQGGKTALCLRFVQDLYEDWIDSTIGASFFTNKDVSPAFRRLFTDSSHPVK